jgi:hypothetical protein
MLRHFPGVEYTPEKMPQPFPGNHGKESRAYHSVFQSGFTPFPHQW